MNNRFRTLGLIGCAFALVLVTACAQASNSYVGK